MGFFKIFEIYENLMWFMRIFRIYEIFLELKIFLGIYWLDKCTRFFQVIYPSDSPKVWKNYVYLF